MFARISDSYSSLCPRQTSAITTLSPTAMFDIQCLPPSDFKDLVLLLERHEASLRRLLRSFRTPGANEATNKQQMAISIKSLQRKSQEIDASYGWVLASDIAMVDRMFDTKNEASTRIWLREMFDRYDGRKEALIELDSWLKKAESLLLVGTGFSN
jgi:hypothetical protein